MVHSTMLIGIATTLAVLAPPPQRSNVRVGINFGFPIHHHRPLYAPVYYPYYRPYPLYVAPAPVYVAPPPVVVQPAPVVYQQVPVVQPTTTNSAGYKEPPLFTTVADSGKEGKYIQQLFDAQERTRADAALELGRMKALQALEPLFTLVNTDKSAMVRDAAVRALGLMGDARALPVLQNAAQSDTDRDVRRSAQFAVEVIRANPR